MARDGILTARVTSFGWPNGTAVADSGVILRTGPTPASGMMFAGIENGVEAAKWRNATGQPVQVWAGPAVGAPFWLGLTRVASTKTVTAWISAQRGGLDAGRIAITEVLPARPTGYYKEYTVPPAAGNATRGAGASCCRSSWRDLLHSRSLQDIRENPVKIVMHDAIRFVDNLLEVQDSAIPKKRFCADLSVSMPNYLC